MQNTRSTHPATVPRKIPEMPCAPDSGERVEEHSAFQIHPFRGEDTLFKVGDAPIAVHFHKRFRGRQWIQGRHAKEETHFGVEDMAGVKRMGC